MTVLIVKQNQDFIKTYYPTVKFFNWNKYQVAFNIGSKRMSKLIADVMASGNNPYAVMGW